MKKSFITSGPGCSAEGCGYESLLGSTGSWKTLSVNPAVNGYLFRIGKDEALKGGGWALPFICCV